MGETAEISPHTREGPSRLALVFGLTDENSLGLRATISEQSVQNMLDFLAEAKRNKPQPTNAESPWTEAITSSFAREESQMELQQKLGDETLEAIQRERRPRSYVRRYGGYDATPAQLRTHQFIERQGKDGQRNVTVRKDKYRMHREHTVKNGNVLWYEKQEEEERKVLERRGTRRALRELTHDDDALQEMLDELEEFKHTQRQRSEAIQNQTKRVRIPPRHTSPPQERTQPTGRPLEPYLDYPAIVAREGPDPRPNLRRKR